MRLPSKYEYVACIRRIHSECSIRTFNLLVRTIRDSSQLYDNMTFQFICGYVTCYHLFTIITPIKEHIIYTLGHYRAHSIDTLHDICAMHTFPPFNYGLVRARLKRGNEQHNTVLCAET
jgi:hypothetical protein